MSNALANRASISTPLLTTLVGACVALLAAFLMPDYYRFQYLAFGDPGANLAVNHLLQQGFTPTVDFGYQYGLLPLVFGRIWFFLLGMSPISFQLGIFLWLTLFCYAIARVLSSIQPSTILLILFIFNIPNLLNPSYPNFTHIMEATLIALALGDHHRGHRSRALAWLTIALFVKPAMAFFYGFLLLLLIGWRSPAIKEFLKQLVPAVGAGSILIVLLSYHFGWLPVIKTLIPLSALDNYAAVQHGFFVGTGRNFWAPPGAHIFYYLGNPVLIWAILSVISVILSFRHLRNLGRDLDSHTELGICCISLHLSFILFFFGNEWSWIYYSYILFVGAIALLTSFPLPSFVILGLSLLSVLSHTGKFQSTLEIWRTTDSRGAVHGLWAPPEDQQEWHQIRRITKNSETFILADTGAGGLLFHDITPPTSFFLISGIAIDAGWQRTARAIRNADYLILPEFGNHKKLLKAPQLIHELDFFEREISGRYYQLWRRKDRL